MKTFKIASIALLVGGVIGFSANYLLMENGVMGNGLMANSHGDMASGSATQNSTVSEPLYWVAPMDPNYQRDKPGKSPMGMDLIPVYGEDSAEGKQPAGTVTISPAVENNLGVKTSRVVKQPLQPTIDAVGYVAFDESTLWQTNVRTSGWVEKLYVDAVGEKVKQGDVLFTFYSPDLVKAQEELFNARRTGRKSLIQAGKERLSALGIDNAQIKQIYSNGKAKQHVDIKAIADGVIANLNIREGGYLSPSQTVISAGPLEQVWVDVELFERQGYWVTAGSQANMMLDGIPGKTWQGRVDYVYPILDPATRTLRVRLKFDNPQGELKPNMFANVTLTPTSETDVLTIPRSAVIRSGDMSRVVLALGDGQYRSARIDTGREAADRIEVLQGLSINDRIVTSAQFMLDSESSQSADLSRINGLEPDKERVWASGQITDLMAEHHMITISHQPVEQWNWPSMVMNFNLDPTLDMTALEQGQSIEFEMEKTEQDQYLITSIMPSEMDSMIIVENQIWIEGQITMLMSDFNMITLSHPAVKEWQWPAGDLNFSVKDNFDFTPFHEGQRVRFLVTNQTGEWQLKQLEVQANIQGGKQ